MKICIKCKTENRDKKLFCRNCGTVLDRNYKKEILEPNKIVDDTLGIDKYILTWCQISEIIEEEIESRKGYK